MIKIYRVHDAPLEFDIDTFEGADMAHACFHRSLLNGMNFCKCSLIDCDFRSAELMESDFNHCNFDESKLIMIRANSNFDYCTFRAVLFLHSDVVGSSFRYADFSDSLIHNVNFSRCDLRGANMVCRELDGCLWRDAVYDTSTLWPEDFKAYKCGAIKI